MKPPILGSWPIPTTGTPWAPASINECSLRPSREVLSIKVRRKLEDLLSARLDFVSFVVGFPLFTVGVASLLILVLGKLSSSGFSGFINPYTFLIAMLLVISGFQIIVFGLLSNLMIQIRKEITRTVQGGG